MGRPKGVPTRRKEFRLEERHVALLEALIEAAPLGKPTLVSVVRQAVQEFIDRQLVDTEVRRRVERILGRPKIVNIHGRRSGDS